MSIIVTERSIRIPIADDIGELIGFYNPITDRFYFFQFGYVDNQFRIIRYVKLFCECVTCTFESWDINRHWSKNMSAETTVCAVITQEDYKKFKKPIEFYAYILEIEKKLKEVCNDFYAPIGVDYSVAGYEFRLHNCKSYAYIARLTEVFEVAKVKQYYICDKAREKDLMCLEELNEKKILEHAEEKAHKLEEKITKEIEEVVGREE